MGMDSQRHARERDPVPAVQEAWWAIGPVRTRAENLAHLDKGTKIYLETTMHNNKCWKVNYSLNQAILIFQNTCFDLSTKIAYL